MKINRKGFTLVELLIVIVVIGVLAAMFILSSTESVTSAKASNIITNLQLLKRAVLAWHMDNREKVLRNGMVKIGNETHPIQEWSDSALKLSNYFSHLGGSAINLNSVAQKAEGTSRKNTDLGVGCYGVCDGGTERDPNDDSIETAYHRQIWYVGYRFTENEEAVKEKLRARKESAGLVFGTADAHIDTVRDNGVAVWMKVF